jgi:hypothetical protein
LFAAAGTTSDITVGKSNELIVYNTPGSSTIGIRSGNILNIYSDTSLMKPEVIRHSATLGLKIKSTCLKNGNYCIRAGEKKILICSSPDNQILECFKPDIVIFTGQRPFIDKSLAFSEPAGAIIFSSEIYSGFHLPPSLNVSGSDTIHFVRKSGAFIESL